MHRPALLRSAALWSLLVANGCLFTFDRNLSPGEIAGTAVYRSAEGTLVPAAGATVTLENSGLIATADSHGRFALVGLPSGTYTIDATDSPGDGIAEVGIRLTGLTLAPADGLDLGQVTLDTFGAIQGSVALDGSPIGPGAIATIAGLAQAQVTAGMFSFPTLLPGTYAVQVFYPDNPGAVVSPPSSVVVAPAATATPSFALTSSSDMVTAGAVQGLVQVAGASSNGGVDVQFSGQGPDLTSSPSGTVSSGGVPAALYTVTAALGGFASVSVPYVVVGGGTTVVPTITLLPVTSVSPDAGNSSLTCAADSECPAGEVCLSGSCGAPVDGGIDAGTDGGLDAGPAPADAGTDGGLDAGNDGGVDGGTVGGVDGGTDGGVDAGTDGGVDAGTDGGVDAGPVPPGAPGSVVATPEHEQISVRWSVQSGLTYNIYYSTTAGTGTGGTSVAGVTSPYVLTSLEDGTPYYVVVTATNAFGESVASVQVTATPEPAGTPGAATGVSATIQSGQVTVHWNSVSGATGYNLYDSTTEGLGTGGDETFDVTSPYTLSGLDAGQTYYIIVTATNGTGEGFASAEVRVTTPAAIPTFVVARAGTGQVAFSWSASTGATSYNLYYSTTSGTGIAGTKVAGLASPYVLTGLQNNTTYYAVVTAVDGGGESPPSDEVSATPTLVSGVRAIAGNGQLGLSWNTVANASSYKVYRSTQSGFTIGTSPLATRTQNFYIDTTVTNYTDYFYLITAIVNGVESTPSPQVSGTPVAWIAVSMPSYDGNYALGITSDGRLWAWGSNQFGVLGLGSSVTGSVYYPTPVGSAKNWSSIAAAGQASFGIAGGALYSWGYDGEFGGLGCLGLGSAQSAVHYTPTQVGSGTTWQTVVSAVNYNFCTSLALQTNGSIWNWGDDFSECPGMFRYAPNEVAGPINDQVAIGVRGPSGFAITQPGKLMSWGVDLGAGLLGLGDLGSGSGSCVSSLTEVGTAANWTSVAGGNFANVGVAGGALYSWGSGTQLGLGNSVTGNVYTPMQVGAATNWTGVFANYNSAFGIADGALYSWGDDDGTGCLGLGAGQTSVDTPTQVGNATNWVLVSSTYQGALGIDSSGNLWGWGDDNGTGMLGLGSDLANQFVPTQVSVP